MTKSRLNEELAREIFNTLIRPEQTGPYLTLGHYGNGLEIPAWAHLAGRQIELRNESEEPRTVATRAREHLDAEFLTSIGAPGPDTATVVEAWLGRAVEELRESPEEGVTFGTERPNFIPMGM